MLFYYIGGALVCDHKIKGITQRLDTPWRVDNRTAQDYRDDAGHLDFDYPDSWSEDWYGGHRYFVCESLTRGAAELIAKSLGGYLFPDRPPLQLSDGGPFYLHRFDVALGSQVLTKHTDLPEMLGHAESIAKRSAYPFRVYDKSGFMVAQFDYMT